MRITRRSALLLPALLAIDSARAQPLPRSLNHDQGVALKGYDTTAWHLEGRPRRGLPAFRAQHGGVAWLFASAASLARFEASPEAFLPRYGGFCAFGVSRGYKVDIDPEAWHLRGGVLYLNYDRGVQRQWMRDIPGHIARADSNWPRLAEA
jgi:hypothetical protein